MPTQSMTTQTDPICGMQVDPNRAGSSSEYNGKTYHFCCGGCKAKFDKNPAEALKLGATKDSSSGGCCCG
jgi:Cu+-exporting ATPase